MPALGEKINLFLLLGSSKVVKLFCFKERATKPERTLLLPLRNIT